MQAGRYRNHRIIQRVTLLHGVARLPIAGVRIKRICEVVHALVCDRGRVIFASIGVGG